MRQASLTFDPPVGTANTPAVLRRRRGWMSPDGRRSVVAFVLALVAHGVVLWVSGLLPTGSGEGHASLRPEETPATLTIPLEVVEEAPPAGAAPAAEPRPESMSPAMAARIATIARVRLAVAATAAEVAARAHAAAPVDLSHMSDAFRSASNVATGSARGAVSAAAGGAGSGGHGTSPHGTGAGTAGAGAGTQTASLAQAARPLSLSPNCPWPAAAHEADVYLQHVMVRAVVDASGHAVSAAALSDPGFGFAAAAEACALSSSYSPARDEAGQPVRATTPAMRLTFRR